MTSAEGFQHVARSTRAVSSSVDSLRSSLAGMGVHVDQVLRGTATGSDHVLGRQLVAASRALSTARDALARAEQAARRAAAEAAAEEQRRKRPGPHR